MSVKLLDSQLAKNRDYESQKIVAAKKVKEKFLAKKGSEPADAEILEHNLRKRYFHQISSTTAATLNQLEESAYELADKALFAKYKGSNTSAQESLNRAGELATVRACSFLDAQLKFSKGLSGASLKKKLQLDRCYEMINKEFGNNPQNASALVGMGFSLADDISDKRRELDLYSKAQYLLYEIDECPHAALSLGMYLIDETKQYETVRCWSFFHNGNIHLDFAPNQSDQDKEGHYASAKQAFENAHNIALKLNFRYADMTMNERLGLTNLRIGNIELAKKHYSDSLVLGQSTDVKPWMALKNRVRCLIGLGDVEVTQSTDAPASAANRYAVAEGYYIEAIELANQINYSVNEAIGMKSLSDLHAVKSGDANNPDTLCLRAAAERVYPGIQNFLKN